MTPKRYLQYRDVLSICLPLVLSISATTLMEFTDRIFLANYQLNTISAALPAASVSFLFLTFFGGVSGYTGVFIAQYTGRGDHRKTGSIFWQGLWFSLAASLFIFALGRAATPIFAATGHPPEIQRLECIYFSILCYGSSFQLAMTTFSAFFTGRGLTRPVMIINVIGVAINIPLDYALIFGHWRLPELGIAGAATATVLSWLINAVLLGLLIFTRRNNRQFAILSGWRLHRERFLRLMRFGVPGAMQLTVDTATFTVFILLVGRIDTITLAATNIVFSLNAISFMPAVGASQGVSILVGQALGNGRPQRAAVMVQRAGELLFCYVLAVALLFIFCPQAVLSPFFINSGTAEQAAEQMAIQLLRYIVTAFLFFDAFYMLFSGALRGAGDTRYMMQATALTGLSTMVIPVWAGITFFNISGFTAWFAVLTFLVVIFSLSLYRYRSGRWQEMMVIEEEQDEQRENRGNRLV